VLGVARTLIDGEFSVDPIGSPPNDHNGNVCLQRQRLGMVRTWPSDPRIRVVCLGYVSSETWFGAPAPVTVVLPAWLPQMPPVAMPL